MFNYILFILISICVFFMPSGATGNEMHKKPNFKHTDIISFGSCVNKKKTLNLSNTIFLQNTSISDPSEKIFIINGQEIIVQHEKSETTSIFSIVDFIEENYKLKNPDIDLSFVLVNNELSIYWRETFLHRSYRQGVVAILKDKVVAVCDGIGGIDSSH